MRIIRPLTITPGMLAASNVTEADYPAYNAGTTYGLGDRVISNHRIYRSVQVDNLGNALSDIDWWLNERATNRWRIFDQRIADQTSNPDSIEVTVTPGELVTAIALFNVDGAALQVTMTDAVEGVVYDHEEVLTDESNVVDWYTYFFEPITRKTEVVLFDLPSYSDAEISIALTVDAGDASLGEIVMGTYRQIGETEYGASLGIQSFSARDRDDFGNWYIVPRDYSDTGRFPVALRTKQVGAIKRYLASLRDSPAVYAGKSDGGWGTLIYGFYEDFDVVLSTPVISDCILNIEGLT